MSKIIKIMANAIPNRIGFSLGFLLVLITLVPLSSPRAIKLPNTNIEKMYGYAPLVATIKITAVRSADNGAENKTIFCGFDYEAEILIPFKGETKTIRFRSHGSLSLENHYLIFFSNEYFDGYFQFLSMGRNERSAYEKCMENSPNLYASKFNGDVFELSSFESMIANVLTGKEWIKLTTDRIKIPDQIESRFIDISGENIPDDYADYYSHTLINRDDLYRYLEMLKSGAQPQQ